MTRRRALAGDASPLAPSPRAPWLGLTGILMLLLGFAFYNSWFGYEAERWPWEVIADGGVDLRAKALLAAWLLAGLWAAALAFVPARRTRSIGCAILGGILVIEGFQTDPAPVLSVAPMALVTLLTMAALGAGLLVARNPALRGRGRLLAGAGGLLVLWLLASPWPEGTSALETTFDQLGRLFGDDAPSSTTLLNSTLFVTLTTLAALIGILAGLGMTGRRFLLGGFFMLLVGLLVSTGALAAEMGFGDSMWAIGAAVVTVLSWNGLLLGLLVLFTVQDLANAGGGER